MNTIELKKRLQKSLDYLQSELSKVRVGRASPSMLEDVKVAAYESQVTIKEVGSIVVSDPQNLVITPWDKSLVEEVARSIRESKLDLNPVVDGCVIRVPFPQLTEERRKDLSKVVLLKVEEVKSSIRNIRQDVMRDIDKDFSNKLIGEDDKFKMKDDVDDVIKEFVEKAEKLGEDKKGDLLRV